MKKTVVIGVSENPARYAYKAVEMLRQYNYPVVAIGLKEGQIGDVEIHKDFVPMEDIDTVTLYVGPKHQPVYYDYIISLSPNRIIFNPGTENPELVSLAKKNNIESVQACTLVMLAVKNY
jgi:uncharacterized protein